MSTQEQTSQGFLLFLKFEKKLTAAPHHFATDFQQSREILGVLCVPEPRKAAFPGKGVIHLKSETPFVSLEH